jgi:iron complex transport system permease protein
VIPEQAAVGIVAPGPAERLSRTAGPTKAIVYSSLALIVVLVIAPLIGSTHIDFVRAITGVSPDYEILFYARLPRVILAALSGAALAITGVLFQCLLRDPLAEPYTLGVSSGASVGAVVAICLGFQAGGLASLAGAGAVLFLVLGIAWEGRRVSSFTLLLAGVTMNSMCFAIILFLHNLANFSQSFAISRWLMGGIDAVEYSTLGWLAAAVVPISVLISTRAKHWNLMAVGEEWASSRGISTNIYTTGV